MGWGYTAPPLQYKYRALGLPLVFLLMGPLMVVGALLRGHRAAGPGARRWPASRSGCWSRRSCTATSGATSARTPGPGSARSRSAPAARSRTGSTSCCWSARTSRSRSAVAFGAAAAAVAARGAVDAAAGAALRASELGATGQQREIAMIDLNTAQLHAAFGALFVLGISAVGVRHRQLARDAGPSAAAAAALAWPPRTAPSRRSFRGPRARFWQRMTRTGLGLGALALATEGDLRRIAAAAARRRARHRHRRRPVRGVPGRRPGRAGGHARAAPRTSATSTCCARCGRRARSPPGWPPSSARPRSCTGAASCRRSSPAGSGRSRARPPPPRSTAARTW